MARTTRRGKKARGPSLEGTVMCEKQLEGELIGD